MKIIKKKTEGLHAIFFLRFVSCEKVNKSYLRSTNIILYYRYINIQKESFEDSLAYVFLENYSREAKSDNDEISTN